MISNESMQSKNHPPNTKNFQLTSLIFGEKEAPIITGFYGMIDQFCHLTPECDYESKQKSGFLHKGNVFSINSITINQNYYSHFQASSPVKQHNILIPLAGHHFGIFNGSKVVATQNQGFFIPENKQFFFETDLEAIAGSLIISYDIHRLNNTIEIMTGSSQYTIQESSVKEIPLAYKTVHFKKLLMVLLSQIDNFNANKDLLALSGFDDQFYRLLTLLLCKEHFLKEEVCDSHDKKKSIIHKFQQFIDENIEKPFHLSDLESHLGVTSRTLQYHCTQHLGLSPRAYIRLRKLEHAYHLMTRSSHLNITELALKLGFSSPSQFSKFFRQQYGVLPSELNNK